jgi:hypothetical protein
LERTEVSLFRLFNSGKTYAEIAQITGLTVDQVRTQAKHHGIRRHDKSLTRAEQSFALPHIDYKLVSLRDLFSKCPNCGGTVNLDGHAMISYCEGACGQEWTIDGRPIPREEWLKLVMV